MIYALALIGAITVAVLTVREIRYQWRNRNSKPTRWLCIAHGEHHLRKTHVFPGIYSMGFRRGMVSQGGFCHG